ncbi:ankyrin repeat domain-containing protein 50-like [Dreissena polymorpha]|uniref:SOCS box domain-containing protein n=1 Tax=Dreissena polymorpha TaxID=45954 RepID=A0A9D4RIJ3_DREPO|nr:ankyrin repeat domain-containing protein 50-like [Dreissena polymorpha]KAH3869881.1 hypothetical protein DPMN_033054 [Dreissena polymorpha]
MATSGRKLLRDSSRAGFEKREKRRQIRRLQEAIDKKDTETVKEILQDEFDVDFQYRGQTALQQAVREGCLDICKLLIAKGANVNMSDAEQNNLLNMACWRGFAEISDLLIQNGADIDERNIHGFTPANTCALQGYPDILQMLISAKADLDIHNQHGTTALHTAVARRHFECVQLLMLGGCRVDTQDERRRTPLIVAAGSGFADVIELLVNGGASVNAKDITGTTALFSAVANGYPEVVRSLVNSGADINQPTTKGVTPLLEAIHNGFTDIAQLLIDSKCDVNLTDRLHQAPIHLAIAKASQFFSETTDAATGLVRSLVEAGCDINLPDKGGSTPLYQSASAGNLDLTEYLLSRSADIAARKKDGDTVLHGAVHGNNPNIVQRLIQAGCPLNDKNLKGEHPLLTAITFSAKLEMIKALVSGGSCLDERDTVAGNTPLHYAILHYNTPAALLLIDSGCDVNMLNTKRHSPLYTACEKNAEEVARRILGSPKFQKRLFLVRNIPQPLFAAVSNGHAHMVDMLIQTGCDINMINSDGQTPVQQALTENCPFVVKLLLKYNCDLHAHARVKRLYKCCLLHEDQHPHFDLEPLFVALTHKSVDLLKLLIVCYWKIPGKFIAELDNVFQTTAELNTHYSHDLKSEIREVFLLSSRFPRSLKECCRALVRERLGACPGEKVEQLPVATMMKDYILMEEYFGDLWEKIEEHENSQPKHNFNAFNSVTYRDIGP